MFRHSTSRWNSYGHGAAPCASLISRELVQKKKFSLVQLLYLIARYGGDANFIHSMIVQLWVPNETSFGAWCRSYGKIQYWVGGVVITAMQAIMVHRVYSMYRQRRAVLIFLLTGLTALVLVSIAVSALFTMYINTGPIVVGPTLRVCLPQGPVPSWTTLVWFVAAMFDCVILSLSIREGLKYMRESQQLASDTGKHKLLTYTNWSKQGLLFRILIRDSITFPFIGSAVCLSNVIVWYAVPPESGALIFTTMVGTAFAPIIGCRLVLNLRDAYYHPFSTEFEQQEFDLNFLATDSDEGHHIDYSDSSLESGRTSL